MKKGQECNERKRIGEKIVKRRGEKKIIGEIKKMKKQNKRNRI